MIDLDKLQALCDAATNSPWATSNDGSSENWAVCYVGRDTGDVPWSVNTIGVRGSELHGDAEHDAAFIAAARTALPELIAEVRRLSQSLDDLQQACMASIRNLRSGLDDD